MKPACDLLIFGASGQTGRWLVQHARARGLTVAAMLHPERDSSELARAGVVILRGDALHAADCRAAIGNARPGTVVSLLGGKDGQGRRVDATGNGHVIAAMQALPDCKRLLLVTSYGCGEQFAELGAGAQQALGRGSGRQNAGRAGSAAKRAGLDHHPARRPQQCCGLRSLHTQSASAGSGAVLSRPQRCGAGHLQPAG
nr:NAD(P)H-binding protein [Chitinilyticum aquatile]